MQVELGLARFLGCNDILQPFSFQLPGTSEQKAPLEERVSARQLPAGRQAGQTVRWASVLCPWCHSVPAGTLCQTVSLVWFHASVLSVCLWEHGGDKARLLARGGVGSA